MSKNAGGYRIYLAYLELARRVRRKLASPNPLYFHVGIYAGILGLLIAGMNVFASYYWIQGIDRPVTVFFGLWTGVLALHGSWLWLRGGNGSTRDRVIEQEMRDIYDQYDQPLGDSVDFFALHSLLQQDIGRRYNFSNLLAVLLWANVLSWGLWLLESGGNNAYPYAMTPIYAFLLIPVFLFFMWRNYRFQKQVRELVQQWTTLIPASQKRKNAPSAEEVYAFAPSEYDHDDAVSLNDDGELAYETGITFDEKRKR